MAETQRTYVAPAVLAGVFVVERPVFEDPRGFFTEVERRRPDVSDRLGRLIQHAQWNHSRSQGGVLRGIHVAAWNKCVYVVRGDAQCVIVDARPASPTFGQYESFVLGESRRALLFVPAGCGNSFLALSDSVDFMYSVDAEWSAGGEYGIAWDDADLAIPWQNPAPSLSDKDQRNPRLRDLFPERFAS